MEAVTKKIELRNLTLDDYIGLKEAMIKAYSGGGVTHWNRASIEKLLHVFPDGQICVVVDGKVAACALSIIIDYRKYGDKHTYDQITGKETFDTHEENGDVLYGIELFVHPDYRGMRLGRR
ncbi:MAG: GNAT family N-acetyltransferase, partial [Mameliella sp.]|nr:GNAT family N-acetyltransferase [Phaeodactylibacter sp.]